MKKEKPPLRCSRCRRKLFRAPAFVDGALVLGAECVKKLGVQPKKPETKRARRAREEADFRARQGVLFA